MFDEKSCKIFVRRDVTFNELDFTSRSESAGQLNPTEVELGQGQETRPADLEPEGEEPRYPERERHAPTRFGIDEFADLAEAEGLCETQTNEPTSIEEAFTSDRGQEWKLAAHEEYQSLMENHTWDLVELPQGRKPIGCKWIFKEKRGKDGSIMRYKACLVARGYTQKYGVDYDKTFSPVVRFSSIRAILTFAVQNDMLINLWMLSQVS